MTIYNKFLDQGFITLNNTYGKETIHDLCSAAELYIKRTCQRRGTIGNAAYKLYRTENLLYDFLVPNLLNSPVLLDLIEQIYPNGFQLQEILLYFSQPNGRFQFLHRDVDHISTELFDPSPPLTAVQIPLVQFDTLIGGTRLVAGSHKSFAEPPSIEQEDLTKVKERTPTIKVGDCLVRDARAWHGAGVNSSEQVRSMFTLAFIPLPPNTTISTTAVSSDVYFNLDHQARKLVAAPPFLASLT
ncbi:MAG: phytanoyl-CoA dioxygenase family protein [Aureispira sp.]